MNFADGRALQGRTVGYPWTVMKVSIKKLIGGLVITALTLGNPFVSPASGAAWCKPAPLITKFNYTSKASYPNAGTFGYYTLPIGAGNLSNYQTRVSVFKGKLDKSKMVSVFAPFSQSGKQRDFASSVPRLMTYVNTDYIGAYNMPYSAVIHDGRMVYAPAPGNPEDPSAKGYSGVLGWTEKVLSESAGFVEASFLTAYKLKATVYGVNLKAIPKDKIVAFTPKAASRTLPRGSYAILVSKGKVLRTYLKGTNVRPTSGVLFQATGSAVAVLKKFLNGRAASYTMPSLMSRNLIVDSVTPTGYVMIAGNKLRIRAINYIGTNRYGATMYDSNFGGAQTRGTATLQTDLNGKVTYARRTTGTIGTLSANRDKYLTFQVAADQAALIKLVSLGQTLEIVESFAASSKNKLTEATGRGAFIVKDGANVKDCSTQSEEIRPRTSIGWNAQGDYFVMTTTMGLSFNDGMYRQGGATIHQVAEWLRQLGATSAVTFDGGGSTAQFATVAGRVARQDLPETEWIRDIPVGVAFASNG